MTTVLTQTQLKRLKEHKYSSEGTSIVEPYFQIYWRWLVEQVPLWWAPNAITLVGLMCNFVTTLIIMLYSPDGRQEPPGWTFFMAGLGMFIYQSLDAIDGKQARRTNSNSPLGELFDHGCDALSTILVLTGIAIALQLGNDLNWFFVSVMFGLFAYYVAHWQTYVTGTLKFNRIDVTEAQLTIILIYVVTAFLGTWVWQIKLPVLNAEVRYIILYMSLMCSAFGTWQQLSVIFTEGGCGKNGSTIADTSILSPILPISIIIVLGIVIWKKSVTNLFYNHPCLYIVSFALPSAKLAIRLVIAHMTKSEMSVLDTTMLGPGMLFLNQYFDTLFNEHVILWLSFLFCSADLLRFCTIACQEICEYLRIYCFTIGPRHPQAEVANNSLNNSGDTTHHTQVSYKGPITRSSARLAKK